VLDLSLIEGLTGASRVVVIDALRSGKPPGTVSTYSLAGGDEPQLELPSLHGLRLSDLFSLARNAGLLTCPVTVIGVEPMDCRPGTRMSSDLRRAVPKVVDAVITCLRESDVAEGLP
jgi:hydrogenase maturation protease